MPASLLYSLVFEFWLFYGNFLAHPPSQLFPNCELISWKHNTSLGAKKNSAGPMLKPGIILFWPFMPLCLFIKSQEDTTHATPEWAALDYMEDYLGLKWEKLESCQNSTKRRKDQAVNSQRPITEIEMGTKVLILAKSMSFRDITPPWPAFCHLSIQGKY